jgi:hypothetical protein
MYKQKVQNIEKSDLCCEFFYKEVLLVYSYFLEHGIC